MSTASDQPSALVRFLDAFVQEKNIKWVLAVGMLILFGSSLMLVTTHWTSYTPIWKYLILLAYTMAVAAGGPWCYHRLGLRRTGTVLMALTVLLLPITFLALHAVRVVEANVVEQGIHLVLLALNLLLSRRSAVRVFRHFLRGAQPTFVGCYLLLCLAGAVVPGLDRGWWPGVTLLLWALFTLGTVKVNRHVFWLAEEQRRPRIFGFFPIALLGTQFLCLFAVNFWPAVPVAWLGLGLALAALPVLLTADAVARVFQQRTGDLVRPLPWSIALPLGAGLTLCAAGLCLAGAGLTTGEPYALVPTATLVAGLLAVVAQRTRKPAFVWAMLLCLLVAYNFAPVFFREFARALIHQGANAVREERLPYAFYGLTYVPLLLALTLAATRLQQLGQEVFARPMRRFCVGLACLLLAASLCHPKALFPVAAVLTGLFALQTVLFRERRIVWPALAAWVLASLGCATFAGEVLDLALPANPHHLCLTVAAGLLLAPGWSLDRRLERLPPPAGWLGSGPLCQAAEQAPCRFTSLLLAVALMGFWLTQPLQSADTLALAGLLGASARRRHPLVRTLALVLLNVQALALTLWWSCPELHTLLDAGPGHILPASLPLALATALSLCGWQAGREMRGLLLEAVALPFRCVLRLALMTALWHSFHLPALAAGDVGMVTVTFALLAASECVSALRLQQEERVWLAEALALAGIVHLATFGLLAFATGTIMVAVLGAGFVLWTLGHLAESWSTGRVAAGPLRRTGMVLPLVAVVLGVHCHLTCNQPSWLGLNSLALLLAAGFYFWRGLEQRRRSLLILSGAIVNVALVLLWRELRWADPQFYLMPLGISILALVEILKPEFPQKLHDPLRYLGALVILVSPTFHIVGGSWLHLFSLMVASVAVVLVAIGIRVRALMYAGTAFLVADLVAMVVRGCIDNPSVLWIAGLALGSGVVAFGAVCENNRELLLQRMRLLAATLKSWD